jgi:signal transduction histidine kinase
MIRERGLDWLPAGSGLTVVALFFGAKSIIGLPHVGAWWPVQRAIATGRADGLWLLVLAIAVGLLMHMVQRRITAADLHRRRDMALLDENAAVMRACRAVVCEFAQPLTGLVAYTELLSVDCAGGSEAQRRDLEGLREGVARLERLLQCLRDTVQYPPDLGDCRRVADEVERALAAPLRPSRG